MTATMIVPRRRTAFWWLLTLALSVVTAILGLAIAVQ